MRILVLAPQPFYQSRGTPIAVRMLVETLAEAGHTVDLLVFHEGEDVPLKGARLNRIPPLPFVRNVRPGFSAKKIICDAAMAFKFLSMARNTRYDVIHAVEDSGFMARGLQSLTGTPYVLDMDSSMPQQIVDRYPWTRALMSVMARLEAWAIQGSRGVVAVCATLEERVREVDPVKPVLRLEDVSLLSETREAEDLRERLSIQGPLILYVGNLESYQGIDLLLDSFELFLRTGGAAHLVIIGGSKEHIGRYRAEVATRRLGQHVHFTGPRPLEKLGGYLSQADILVSPRTHGTNTPMKIFSYLDSGTPIVATRRTTHTQVLDDEIAFLSDHTPEAMADAFARLIRDRELGRRLAANARERVALHYSASAFRRKLIEFYGSLEGTLVPAAEHDPIGARLKP